MKRSILTALFVLFAHSAFAQTPPCDIPPPSIAPVSPGVHVFGACWNGKDASTPTGVVITAPVTWSMTVDGTKSMLPAPTVNPLANAAGEKLYSWSLNVAAIPTPHNYVLEICVTGGGCSSATPFSFPVIVPVVIPSAPTKIRVQ